MYSCRCCLRCAPDKDLTTPYTHLGVTEIYADMLQECFDIHLVLGEEGSRGICSACVGRLRDASDFKLQVQRSQAELQEELLVKIELEPLVKSELADEDDDPTSHVADEEPIVNLEMGSEDETGGVWDEDPLIKSEMDVMNDDYAPVTVPAELATSESTCAQQHQATCSAELERLQGDDERTILCSTRKSYTCGHCSKHFENKSFLRTHIQQTHFPSASKDLSSILQTKLLDLEHVSNFKCTECEYATVFKKNFEAHIKNHTLKQLFKCEHCNYTCQYRSYLLRHQIKHTGERFFMCSDCDFKCNDKSNLRRHRRIHSSDKPYQCNICNYKCREKIDLQRHQYKHTKEKPFKCNICEYRCTLKSKLRIHERTHTKEKPFQCSNCDYKCSHKSQLQNHERIHTGVPFTCGHCDYASLYKEHLQRHLKTKHPDEKNNLAPQVLGM